MRIAGDDTREFLNKIFPFVESDGGRNLNEMSRSLSIPYQTIRFRMLHLQDQGITVRPIVDIEKLGLGRYRVFFDVSNDLANLKALFGGLSQNAGLAYYARTEISQMFDCEFNIPSNKEEELRRLLATLEGLNIIKNIKVSKLIWKELLGMRTRFYDYVNRQWDVDYKKLVGDPSLHQEIRAASELGKFDHKDLLIIKSLQIKPWIKVTELSEKLNIQEADIAYHLNKHVFGKRLISKFVLKWIGPKEAWSKHSIVPITLLFSEISETTTRYAMSVLTSIPFTWNHMKMENSSYMGELLVPLRWLPETMRYLSDNMRGLDLVPKVMFTDPYCVSSYTIPYNMHNKGKGWIFKNEDNLGRILQMIKRSQ